MVDLTLAEVLVGIISALVLAILGYIAVKTRGRIKTMWAGFQTGRQFGRRAARAGLSNFYVGRADWTRYRKPAQLTEYLDQANTSVRIVCYWMAQGTIEGVPQTCGELAERGVDVEISMIDPFGHLPEVLAPDLEMSPQAIRSQVRGSLEKFKSVRAGLDPDAASRLRVKVSDSLPQAAVIMLDSGTPTGRIQLEFRPYRSPRSDSFSFELTPTNDGGLYSTIEAAWGRYLRDAKQV